MQTSPNDTAQFIQMASKRTRILIAAACVAAVLAAAAVLTGGQFFIHSHEGYFSPVFSPDRRSIYFIERRTRGIVWGLGVEHFTPPAHAYVLQDRIFLNRLDRDSGRVETLARWPSSPLVRKHMRTYRNRVFSVPSARLQFNDDGDLHYAFGLSIPKQPRSESWWLRDSVPPGVTISSPPEWQSGDKRLYGHARYVLDGDWELIHFYGEAAFPPAIVLYNADTQGIRIVKRAPAFESQFPEGIPPRLLADRSVRKNVERIDELKQTRERLLAEFRQQGLSDGDARLRTTDALREFGYLSKPEIVDGAFGGRNFARGHNIQNKQTRIPGRPVPGHRAGHSSPRYARGAQCGNLSASHGIRHQRKTETVPEGWRHAFLRGNRRRHL